MTTSVRSLQGRVVHMTRADVGTAAWAMIPQGQLPARVPPARQAHVRPMSIDFGAAKGTISVGFTGATRQPAQPRALRRTDS